MTRLIRAARQATTPRLLVALAACLVAGASVAAIAIAATSSGPVPAPKPLAEAIHDAATAPKVAGITARIAFTNKLIDSSSVQGSDPLLSGATGRLWLGSDHRFRLELQSERGDVQVVSDGATLGVYDPALDLAYRIALPKQREQPQPESAPPSIADIQKAITRLMRHADVSGAQPTDVAGQAAYSVRIAPKRDGGLIGAAELAWDAVRGAPLRAAVYARGNDTPVLELEATDISYGSVPASTFEVPPPAGVKVTTLRAHPRSQDRGTHRVREVPTLDFALSAPDTLAGMRRSGIRRLDFGDKQGAIVTYGRGLGGLAVLESPADPKGTARLAKPRDGEGPGLTLPTTDIGGASAQVLPTALGTIVRFDRAGVSYVVAGSVSQSVAEAAARGL